MIDRRRFLTGLGAGLCLLSALACRRFPGHPVHRSEPRLEAGRPSPAPQHLAEPAEPSDGEAVVQLFGGLERVLGHIERLGSQKTKGGREPTVFALPTIESSVLQRYRGGGFGGAVRSVAVIGSVGRVPLAPRAMADLMMEPEVERAVLAAHAFRRVGWDYVFPRAVRGRYRVELRGIGAGPFRFNLAFTLAASRLETSDGRVWMRYDPDVRLKPEHVTLYRGGCLIEPDGSGSRVIEVIILGVDITMPPPFGSEARNLTRTTLSNRAVNLWKRAWAAK